MQINSVSFKGIKLSSTNAYGQNMKVYKLTMQDEFFLKQLQKQIDLKKLNSQISDYEYEIKNDILQKAFTKAISLQKSAFLLTCNDKPCGLMVSTKEKNAIFVDYITTWPLEPDKKAPFGAQVLFENLYKTFLDTQAYFIELFATRFGDAVSKYGKVGFKSRGGDNYTEIMRIYKNPIQEHYQKLQQKFKSAYYQSTDNIDLASVCKLDFPN